MRKKDDPRQMQLNLDTTNIQIVEKQIETASVFKLSTKIEQKNNSELKQLYVEILKSVEHIK